MKTITLIKKSTIITFAWVFIMNIFSLSFFANAENISLYENDHKNRIIIHNDIGPVGDSHLFFGDSFSHSLIWDNSSNAFVFSDDVNFSGNEIKNVRLENLSSAPVCNSSSSGRVYHNTSDAFSYVCNGTVWNEIDKNESAGGKLQPYFSNISPNRININETTNLIISGGNFDEDTVFTIGAGVTVNSIVINSDKQATVNVTSTATEYVNISVDAQNNALNDFGQTLAFNVEESTWSDLRSGGDVFTHGNAAGNDIRYKSGMNLIRDAGGMYFSGAGPWSSWVKIESLGWQRGDNKTLQWIFKGPTSAMMIGIGSDATNEGASNQYAHAEVEAYFNSSTNLWGFYGNNGNIGSYGSQSAGATIASGGIYKIKFTNDGTRNLSVFTLYELPSGNISDWDDESVILKTTTVAGTLNPDETNLMPFIIPQNGGSQRFIAVKVE